MDGSDPILNWIRRQDGEVERETWQRRNETKDREKEKMKGEKNGSAGQLWCQSERMWAMWAANKSRKTETRRHKECSKNEDERQEVSDRWWKCHWKELRYWMRINVSVYVSLYLLSTILTGRGGGVGWCPWGQIHSVPLPLSAAFMFILHVSNTAVGSVSHHSVSTCARDHNNN